MTREFIVKLRSPRGKTYQYTTEGEDPDEAVSKARERATTETGDDPHRFTLMACRPTLADYHAHR